MGNVCGCVRAEKEEQFLDPAKTPLSPERYPAGGRRYFRRDTTKKTVGDAASVDPNQEHEGRGVSIPPSREQAAPRSTSRGLGREGSASPHLPLEEGLPHEKTEVLLLPGAASGGSHPANTSPAPHGETQVKVSDLQERLSEDSAASRAERKKHLADVNTREITFQRRADVFSSRKAASLSSIPHGAETALEESGFSEAPAKHHSRVQGKQNAGRFCPHATHCFRFEQKRCHSLGTDVSFASRDTDGNEVSVTGP